MSLAISSFGVAANSVYNISVFTNSRNKTDFNKIINALELINVESRPLWKPMHMQPLFKNSKCLLDGTSEKLFKKGLCLPSSTTMTKKDVKLICNEIIKSLEV